MSFQPLSFLPVPRVNACNSICIIEGEKNIPEIWPCTTISMEWFSVPLVLFVKGGQSMLERDYQSELKKRLKAIMPDGSKIIKNDSQMLQGVADLLVSYGAKCAWLEVKRCKAAPHRPNQDYYVEQINSQGGFARFIYPENEEEIFSELRGWFT